MTGIPLRDRIKIFRQKLSRTGFVQWLVTGILALYLRLVYTTSRYVTEIPDATKPYQSGEKHCIFAFWHGRLVMIPPHKPPHRPMHVMISRHNDGELIAQTVDRFAIHTVRGSTSKGGMLAGRDVIKLSRQGDNVSITPDGPRGPNRQAQAGIIQLARMCGCPIVPITCSSSKHKALNSWDRMQIPLPFGTFASCVGEPIEVPRDAGDRQIEKLRVQLEERLNALTTRADALAGLSQRRSDKSASVKEVTSR